MFDCTLAAAAAASSASAFGSARKPPPPPPQPAGARRELRRHGQHEAFLFLNDDQDQTEECFLVKILTTTA